MSKFKFSHGLIIGLILGLIVSISISLYAQPSGLYVEELPPILGQPGSNGIKYSMYFERLQVQHHGETIEVDVHKLMNLLRNLK